MRHIGKRLGILLIQLFSPLSSHVPSPPLFPFILTPPFPSSLRYFSSLLLLVFFFFTSFPSSIISLDLPFSTPILLLSGNFSFLLYLFFLSLASLTVFFPSFTRFPPFILYHLFFFIIPGPSFLSSPSLRVSSY